MGLFERWANWIVGIATGSNKRRWILTPVIALIFLSVIALLIIAALLTDKWLNFPRLSYFPWTLICSLVLFVPGFILYFWTIGIFTELRGTAVPINPPQELITTGPYAYSRNPMMLGIFLMLFGTGFFIGSLALTVVFIPLFILLMTLYARLVEEKELELRFGQPYLDYKNHVPMYVPMPKRREAG
jgi:protein-S-isoprenylcysteine O-methyltransferase Ste14